MPSTEATVGAGSGDSFTFSAFISYARKDRAEAVRLQRRLEQYRLDADLRIKDGERSFPARPLQPIFRDEDELVPGQDLTERIRKGLAASRFLIVLASPPAAQSEWVEKEILDFMALGKADKIIVLVIDGEPNAAKSGNPPERECLPRPFLVKFDANREATGEPAAEPDWVDWRGRGKTDRINFLRLVAALLELDRLDDLIQRDAQAERGRLRFARAVAGVMFVLFIASMLAAWLAFQQRTRALIAESNFLANQAIAVGAPDGDWRRGDALRAVRIALEGARITGGWLDRPGTASIETVLQAGGPNIEGLRATLRGHEREVRSAAFSPDGTKIVTASDDKTARLWDARNGKPIATLRGHENVVNSAAFSPDSTKIVTASDDKTARVWDARDGRPIATLSGHKYGVTSAAFSPDSTKIVTASFDSKARLWNGRDGKPIATLSGHENFVFSAAFSPDGAKIVTASSDNTARLWNARNGEPITILSGHESEVRSAAFSPDSTKIVTASFDSTARLWDARDGKPIATLSGLESELLSAAFSPDGTRIVTVTGGNSARLWDAGALAWPETGVSLAQRACAILASYGLVRLNPLDATTASRTVDAPHPCERRSVLSIEYFVDLANSVWQYFFGSSNAPNPDSPP